MLVSKGPKLVNYTHTHKKSPRCSRPVLFIDKYLFKEVSAIKMRACLWVGRTTTAIHSFDDFIWTRELSACDNALLFTLR